MSLYKGSLATFAVLTLFTTACNKGKGGLADSTGARMDSMMAAPAPASGRVTDSSTLRTPTARDSARVADSVRTADSLAKATGRGRP